MSIALIEGRASAPGKSKSRLKSIRRPSRAPKKRFKLSPQRLSANRQNARKSTGPRTSQGKTQSSHNSLKHGLCSQSPRLQSECSATYNIFVEELRQSLRPTHPIQLHLFDQLCTILWRLQRANDTEKELYNLQQKHDDPPCLTLAKAFHKNPTSNPFLLYSRYERHLRNTYLRLLNELKKIQKHDAADADHHRRSEPAWSPEKMQAQIECFQHQPQQEKANHPEQSIAGTDWYKEMRDRWKERDKQKRLDAHHRENDRLEQEAALNQQSSTASSPSPGTPQEVQRDASLKVERSMLDVGRSPSPRTPQEGQREGSVSLQSKAQIPIPPTPIGTQDDSHEPKPVLNHAQSPATSGPKTLPQPAPTNPAPHQTISDETNPPPIAIYKSQIANFLPLPYTTCSQGDPDPMIEKIFKAYDVRATYPNPLNEEMAWRVGHASGQYLKRSRQGIPADQRVRNENSMIVGRDMRPSSRDLAKALADGIRSTGTNVIDIGLCDTSMVYFAINHEDCVGGVMTTASHNPINYNGFKISGPKARPIGAASGLDDIKRIASILRVGQTGQMGEHQPKDLWPAYRKHVLQFLKLSRPLRVAIDATNGMAGKMVPAVFGDVPDLEIIPVLFEITGSFTHDPNPLVTENLAILQEKIAQTKPDLGVAFDGDADRCIFLTEWGAPIGCDLITALLAADFLKQPQNKGATVVYDLRSSHVVADEVKAAGGIPRRERVGHAYMKKTLAETRAVFGGELSGHFYFRDNFFADSGAIAFARVMSVLSAQDRPMSELMSPLRRYAQSGELNFQIEDKDGKIRELADIYRKAQIDYLDGITVDCGDWWFNVRKSNTEPLLRLNLEAKDQRLLEEKLTELKGILGEPLKGH